MFKNDLLAGKRILITGGGTGLGRSMGERYLQLGAELYICGRRGSVLEEAANEMMAAHGGTVHWRSCDIRVAHAANLLIMASKWT